MFVEMIHCYFLEKLRHLLPKITVLDIESSIMSARSLLLCRSSPISAIVEGYMSEYDPRQLVEFEHAFIPQLLRRGEDEWGPKLTHNLSSLSI